MIQKITRQCLYCNKDFATEQRYIKRGHGKFCSIACSSQHSVAHKPVTAPNVHCSYCGKSFYKNLSKQKSSKSGLYFCCREHKDIAQRLNGLKQIQPSHYGTGNGTHSYRSKALAYYPNQCTRCGWNEVAKVLQVHHKNHNRGDNSIENLEILCPNCHAIHHWG